MRFIIALLLLLPTAAMAKEITSCSSPKGKSFFHNRKDWIDDKLVASQGQILKLAYNIVDIKTHDF